MSNKKAMMLLDIKYKELEDQITPDQRALVQEIVELEIEIEANCNN